MTDGLGADVWRVFKGGVYTLLPGETVQTGQVFCRNILLVQGRNDAYPQFSKPDTIVLPTDASAGFNAGVYAGPPLTNTLGVSQQLAISPLIYSGTTPTRVGVSNGGTTAIIGGFVEKSAVFGASASPYGAASAAYTVGRTLGVITGYQIATSSVAAVASGAQTVTMNSIQGITTTTPITFDYQNNGVAPQEVVTPSAVTQAVLASATVTIAGTAAAGTTVVVNVGNIPGGNVTVTYVTVAADTTATIIAGKIVALLNATTAVRGLTPALSFVQNTAGVITIGAGSVGTGPNAYTLTTSATGGTVTSVASGATLAGGTFPSITATFANAHASGAIVLGQVTTTGAVIIPAPATANTTNVGLVNVDIPSIT